MRYIIVLLTALSFIVTDAQAQKFGHINTQALLDTLPEYKAAQETVAAQYQEIQTVLQEQEQALLALKTEIETLGNTWSEFLLQQKVKQFDTDAARLQESSAAAEKQLVDLETQLTTPIITKAREAIQAVGKNNGYTYIFDVITGVILYDGGEDVLPLVLAEIQSMNAAAATGE